MTLRFWLAAALLALVSLTPVSAQNDSNRCQDGFRPFDHELLMTEPVCIPVEPQRIAALDRFSFETLMALGVQPVASSGFSLSLVRDLSYLETATAEVVNLGQPPNIELLLTEAPDLILSIDGYGEYEQLAAIAPTVQLNFESSADWQTVAAAFGDAANLSAEVEAAFDAYQERLNVLGDLLGDPSEVEVSVVRVAPDYISLYSQDQTGTFLGVILGDAGFAVPSAQAELAANDPTFDGTVSLEQLPLVEGDVLFIWTFATSDEVAANARQALDDLVANPLWASLEVIQNEAAHVVGGYWIGSSFHAAHAVIDDLFTYVAGVDPSEVSPNPFTSAVPVDTAGCEAGFKPVAHALGETCVPLEPQRIASLDMVITEMLLLEGLQPVTFSSPVLNSYARMNPALGDEFEQLAASATDIGFPPNVEAILNAAPDLIIGPRDQFSEALYPQLSEIAPTVLYDPAPGDWRSRLLFAGEVLGMTERVNALLSDYDVRIEAFRGALADLENIPTLSLVRTFPGQIGLVLEGTAAAVLLAEVGVPRPEAQAISYQTVLETLDGRPELLISAEELDLAEGDVVFVFGDPSELFEAPLWGALEAVAEERVHEVGYYWWGDSLFSAHAMLDDLFIYVASVNPSEISPNPFLPAESE